MCNAKTEGGQRCFAGAKTALAKAEERVAKAAESYQSAVARNAPTAVRATLLRRGMKAEYAYEDSLAEYGSTEQGFKDLERRAAEAPLYVNKDDTTTVTADVYREAMREGKRIREQRAEIKRAVRAGELTPERAADQAKYPNAFIRQYRDERIAAAVERLPAPYQHPVNLPASAAAACESGETITAHRFACENHDAPGECDEECAHLIQSMSGEEGVTFDPTGTSYPAPKSYVGYFYDPSQRAVVEVTYTPNDLLDT